MAEEDEVLPDHLRCSRTDGRQWRCRRRVMDNLKLCEIHYLQGRHRQYKEKVPESLKLQRKRKNGNNDSKNDSLVVLDNVEIRALNVGKKANLIKKRRKFSDSSEAVDAHPVKKKALKQGGMQLELIRMVLKKEIEKRKKKKQGENKKKKQEEEEEEEQIHYNEGELTRELPNGVMAISSASTPQDYNNVGSHCDVKVGIDHKAITPRYFRSKNVERLPAGKLQVFPFGRNLKKFRWKKCHWCQKSDSWNLIKCLSCQKEFFCMDCIKERYFETQNEVKMACPVCLGTCSCKDCLTSQCKDSESKENLACKSRVDRILCFHYMICMLLPVLKQISEDPNIELEAEVKSKEKRTSDSQIKKVEFCRNEQNCWIPNKLKDGIACENHLLDVISDGNSTATSSPDCTACNGSGNVSCLPSDLGGCDDCLLDLRCVFPISLIKEMETKAEEISCCYDFPESLDKSSSCSLCLNSDSRIDRYKQRQEAALREDSDDNFLFHPTVLDVSRDNFEHFQKHWRKGHPVVVRDVLQSKSNHSWDPVVMFCAYLERSITRYENDKDLLETCLDWCEVEINIKQYFSGSLRCQPQKNTWHEMLKLKGWLSSQLFKEQFPTHFAQVIAALPLQEYMNPISGILNLAANLPQESAKHDIGPFVSMSYGCADEQVDSVTKLCYDSYDVVNIMAYSTDVPLSSDQLTKIRKLLKKHQNLCQTESPKIITEQIMGHSLKENSLLHAEDKEQNGVQIVVREEMNFFRRVNRTTFINTEAGKAASKKTNSNIFPGGECDSDTDSDSDFESPVFHGTAQNTPLSTLDNPRYSSDSSNDDRNKNLADHTGAQWDVFRRQDVPKLIEYLKRHCTEFADTQNYKKKMIQPILDQIIFLDNTHKMRLKEEFEIEPWTFEQHVGEAVIIPAGCPYQIRNSKCCVHVMLEFVSPENVTESIELIDEVHLLPEGHKAKVDKLEMKKMALYSIKTAIKEIGDLTCKK